MCSSVNICFIYMWLELSYTYVFQLTYLLLSVVLVTFLCFVTLFCCLMFWPPLCSSWVELLPTICPLQIGMIQEISSKQWNLQTKKWHKFHWIKTLNLAKQYIKYWKINTKIWKLWKQMIVPETPVSLTVLQIWGCLSPVHMIVYV